MADYDGSWIAQLVATKPTGTEPKSQGDDAIREIKRALKAAFPNSPVNDSYAGTLSQLNQLVENSTIPRDMIAMWSGSLTTSPVGWTICDGRARPGGGFAPDLRFKFVFGAGTGGLAVGTTGGNSEISAKGNLGTGALVNYTTSGTALSKAQLPSNLTTTFPMSLGGGGTNGINHTEAASFAGGQLPSNGSTTRTVSGTSGQPHTHTFNLNTVNTGANLPPYYALAYIIKD